jgi:hypothetical protein
MLEWRTISHTHGNNRETERIVLELRASFVPESWNRNTSRPILELSYHDTKKPKGYFLDRLKKKWYQPKKSKSCTIQTYYFQSHPEIRISTQHKEYPNYNEFDLNYCKEYAIKTFKERLTSIYKQLNSREFLVEKIRTN